MQQYFSHICDGTGVQADWSCTYGRAPNAIDISEGSLTCPSYTVSTFLYGDSSKPARRILDLNLPASSGAMSMLKWTP